MVQGKGLQRRNGYLRAYFEVYVSCYSPVPIKKRFGTDVVSILETMRVLYFEDGYQSTTD